MSFCYPDQNILLNGPRNLQQMILDRDFFHLAHWDNAWYEGDVQSLVCPAVKAKSEAVPIVITEFRIRFAIDLRQAGYLLLGATQYDNHLEAFENLASK